MEGIAEAIDRIIKLAADAAKTTVLEVPERKGVYLLIGPDGKPEQRLAEPAWHRESLGTPADLLHFVQDHKGGESAVFYDDKQINLVYSLPDRRDVATCALPQSPQYQWLLKPAGPMRQVDFIRLLRITMRGCLSADTNLLTIVRNLRFSTAADGAGDIQHGKQSVGRNISAQVTGESSIPEEVRLIVPVFENHPYGVPVSCAIEINPTDQTLALTPYPLEVRRAMDLTLANIAEMFTGEELPPLYRGQA